MVARRPISPRLAKYKLFPIFPCHPSLICSLCNRICPHLHEFAHLKCVAVRCIGAEGGGWFGRTTVARLVEREREGAVRLQLLSGEGKPLPAWPKKREKKKEEKK